MLLHPAANRCPVREKRRREIKKHLSSPNTIHNNIIVVVSGSRLWHGGKSIVHGRAMPSGSVLASPFLPRLAASLSARRPAGSVRLVLAGVHTRTLAAHGAHARTLVYWHTNTHTHQCIFISLFTFCVPK